LRRRPGYPEIVTCALTWGSIGLIRKEIALSSSVVVFFRLFLGMVVVLAYLAVRGRLGALRLGTHRGVLIGSGVVLGVHWILEFEGYRRLDIAPTILIVFLGPVLMAAAAPAVLKERLHPVAIGALALAFGGIALIAVPDIGDVDGLGLASAIGSAVLFAVLLLMGKIVSAHYEPAAVVVWQLGIASILLAPTLAGSSIDAIARGMPLMLVLGFVHTGVTGILFFHAVRALQAQRLGVLFYLEPASAVAYAWVFLGETPRALTLVGGALILVAGIVTVLSDRAGVVASPDMPGPVTQEVPTT